MGAGIDKGKIPRKPLAALPEKKRPIRAVCSRGARKEGEEKNRPAKKGVLKFCVMQPAQYQKDAAVKQT